MLHGNIGTLHAESLMLRFPPLYQTFILGQDMLISVALDVLVIAPFLTDSVSLCVAAC